MKGIMAAVVLGLFAAAAQAQEGPTPEQVRMSNCNAEANKQKVMRFGERKTFVDACMRGETPKKMAAKPAPKKAVAKQDKSQVCNKQASDRKLKGDDRKKYMNTCMKA
jgi:psiF repeat